jgi:hypothetical protein
VRGAGAGYISNVERKAQKIIPMALTVVCLVLVLNACSLLGTDVMDRINAFAIGLNSPDRSGIGSNFDQTTTTLDATFWSTNFAYSTTFPYIVTLIDYSNPSNVTAAIVGPPAFNGNTGLPVAAVFVMNKVGIDWFIQQLYLNGSSTPLIY